MSQIDPPLRDAGDLEQQTLLEIQAQQLTMNGVGDQQRWAMTQELFGKLEKRVMACEAKDAAVDEIVGGVKSIVSGVRKLFGL